MLGRILAVAWIAFAVVTGCQQAPKQSQSQTTDPFEGAVAQPAKPETEVSTSNLDDMVKISGNQMFGKLYFPTGEPGTSLLMIEQALPTEIQANKPFDFDIKITNIAKLKLDNIRCSLTVPGTLKIRDVTEGTPDGKPATHTIVVGPLGPGENKFYRLQGTATQSGPLGMCMSASYDVSLCMVTTVVAPALKLSGVGPAEIMKCDPLSYKFTVTNTGSGQARNVKVESVLPEGLLTQDGKAAVAFDAGTLSAGESKEFAFVAKASKTGTYAVKASAKADEGLVSESTAVNTVVREPILTITKTGPEKSFIGQPVAYEITVTNKGDAVARNVSIMDKMPKGVTIQTVSDNGKADTAGNILWTIGELAPGASKKVVVVISFDQAGDLRTAASVKADCAQTQATMIQTSFSGVPAIAIEVIDQPDPVRVGEQTTYTIEVTNQGTADGTNIKLVCEMEDPMQFIAASGTTKEKVQGNTITFDPIHNLPPKAKATYKVTVKAVKPGDVRFKTVMSSDQLGRPVEETEATNFFGQ
ncbi:MAG: hypothetical protein KatS3mg104_2538 [Phycisphaerae bacterium]|nr:MAG: hypothetical protein KatS3mg104_2538 [Phycisphaerae bacterium]